MPREVVPYTDTMSSWPRRHIIVMDFNSLCIHLFLATLARIVVDFNSSCAYTSLLGRVGRRHVIVVDFIYISSWPRRASACHCRGLHIHLFLAASDVDTSLSWTSYTSLLGRVGRRHVIVVDFNSPCAYTYLLGRVDSCLSC